MIVTKPFIWVCSCLVLFINGTMALPTAQGTVEEQIQQLNVSRSFFPKWLLDQFNIQQSTSPMNNNPKGGNSVTFQNPNEKTCDGGPNDWSYDCDGPETWAAKFGPTCSGMRQSPIDLVPATMAQKSISPLVMFAGSAISSPNCVDNPSCFLSGQLISEGHTLEFVPSNKDDVMMYMAAHDHPEQGSTHHEGGLYNLQKLHFHWGSSDNSGSEHTINGKAFPMEMHLEFMNKKYRSMEEALKQEDGVTHFGVLFEVSGTKKMQLFDEEVNQLTMRHASTFRQSTSSHSPHGLPTTMNMNFLLDLSKQPMYYYSGSLTTPGHRTPQGCNENVEWVISALPQPISSQQLTKFRNLQDVHGHPLQDNFRPTMPLNGRVPVLAIA